MVDSGKKTKAYVEPEHKPATMKSNQFNTTSTTQTIQTINLVDNALSDILLNYTKDVVVLLVILQKKTQTMQMSPHCVTSIY